MHCKQPAPADGHDNELQHLFSPVKTAPHQRLPELPVRHALLPEFYAAQIQYAVLPDAAPQMLYQNRMLCLLYDQNHTDGLRWLRKHHAWNRHGY